MARTIITPEIIEKINTLYLKIGTYSGVSKIMGGSPSPTTVKKYIIPNFVPRKKMEIKKFNKEISEPNYEIFKIMKNWGDLCVLSVEEEKEVEELWKELVI